jgi:signal transduction histidine kinase/CheY-like chemotaxis protein/HPt (histidine-containing phosphotransfer) domain-containing protein
MSEHIPEKYINTKVTIGFLLILIIAALAFGVNYSGVISYLQINEKRDPLGDRLMSLNELIFRMQEADGSTRLFSLTGNQKDFRTYRAMNDSVMLSLKRLQKNFSDTNYQAKVDTLKTLLEQKKKQTAQLIELSEINNYRRRYGNVLSILPDSINYQISQITYSSVYVDSIAEAQPKSPEHKSFFGRIASILTGRKEELPSIPKTPEVSQIVDSSKIIRIRKDPALEEVKQQLEKIEEQDKRFTNLLAKREGALIQLGNKLTNTIRQMVKYLEEQALAESLQHQKEIDKVKKNLLRKLIFLGVSALLIFLGFVLWIGRDLRKSRHLKEQLIRSREKVESLMKVKEKFLANMSHEIRTPLTSIIGFSELLKEKDSSAELIHNSALHLLALVNDVLDFSSLEEGKLSFHKESINAYNLVQETWMTFRPKAEQKQLDFSFSADDKIPDFSSDKTRLRQILFNLTGNAIKFTETGKVWINLEKQNNWLIFEVGDTGIGIPAQKRKVIFEEFTQLNPPVSKRQKGTGLGLAISKKLVDAMGGFIEVNSNDEDEKHGSIFRFKIPFENNHFSTLKTSKTVTDIQGLKIMIVDDDPLVSQLIKGFIRGQASVSSFSSPLKALKHLEDNQFDIIIADFRMPDLNGLELIKKIRDRFQTPVLLLSAAADEHLGLKKQADVMQKVFTMPKPFSKEDLMEKIQLMLEVNNTEGTKQQQPHCSASFSTIDLTEVLSFTGNDKKFLSSVINTFLSDAEKNIDNLSGLIRRKKTGEISERAHKMLTGFRQFGIKEGATILKGIEILGRRPGSTPELKRGLKRLKKLWSQVSQELNNFLMTIRNDSQ